MRKDYIGTLYMEVSEGWQKGIYPIARTLKAEKHDLSVVEIIKYSEGVDIVNGRNTITKQAVIIGCMDNRFDNTFESANRVYDSSALCPTIPTCGGGNLQPKILEVKKLSDVNELGFLDNGTGKHQSNIVYGTDSESPTVTTVKDGGTQQIKIVDCQSLRMVRTEEGKKLCKAYESGEIHHGFNEYREPEPRTDNMSNTITTVQKDNLLLEIKKEIDDKYHNFLYEIDGEIYLIRIRKLTPKECWRLMDFTDEDFEKAEEVVSNTQLYKQAGNSIVKNCLVAILGQMIPSKQNIYKERSDEKCNSQLRS